MHSCWFGVRDLLLLCVREPPIKLGDVNRFALFGLAETVRFFYWWYIKAAVFIFRSYKQLQ